MFTHTTTTPIDGYDPHAAAYRAGYAIGAHDGYLGTPAYGYTGHVAIGYADGYADATGANVNLPRHSN